MRIIYVLISIILIILIISLIIIFNYSKSKYKKICNEKLYKKTGRDYTKCCIKQNKNTVKNINRYLRKNPQKIPKIIHQIWLGPKKIPNKWLDTFRKDFISKFPDWKYYLWTDKEVKKLRLKNRKAYDIEKTYNGKSDILRYELLYQYGGMYIDADSSWLGKDLNELINKTNYTGFFIAKECGEKNKKTCKDGLASGVVGSSIGNPITKYLVDKMHKNYFKCYKNGAAYETIGPYFVDQVLDGFDITIFPYYYFYPIYWLNNKSNKITVEETKSKFTNSYMTQHGYTTNSLK